MAGTTPGMKGPKNTICAGGRAGAGQRQPRRAACASQELSQGAPKSIADRRERGLKRMARQRERQRFQNVGQRAALERRTFEGAGEVIREAVAQAARFAER